MYEFYLCLYATQAPPLYILSSLLKFDKKVKVGIENLTDYGFSLEMNDYGYSHWS